MKNAETIKITILTDDSRIITFRSDRIEWMRRSYDQNVAWVKHEYRDFLNGAEFTFES